MFNPYSVIKAINYNRETKQHTCKIEKGRHRLKPYHPEKGYKHQRHLFLLKLTKMGRPSNFKKR